MEPVAGAANIVAFAFHGKGLAVELGVDWMTGGDGFTWESDDLEATAEAARDAWEHAKEAIGSGSYQLVILDEATYPVTFGWIDVEDVTGTIRERPDGVNLIITGRDAHEQLIALADTVTEMRKVKHAFDHGIQAKKGLDY